MKHVLKNGTMFWAPRRSDKNFFCSCEECMMQVQSGRDEPGIVWGTEDGAPDGLAVTRWGEYLLYVFADGEIERKGR